LQGGNADMELMIWNVVLTFVSALILMWVKSVNEETKRVQILLNKTREEMPKEYVTKADVHNDMNRVIQRLDRLDAKLDEFMKEQRSALS
jgi:DNA polymerase III delta prime subunit